MTHKVITLIGAGSTVFASELIRDFLSIEAIDKGEIRLIDLDPIRLELARQFAQFLIHKTQKNWTVRASTDRTSLLAGSDVVISTIEVAGLANVNYDYEIPLKYGVDQCIGDTIGPGGLFKAFRTIPAIMEILKDVERLCPSALVLNHTNPMSMVVLAAAKTVGIPVWGMCHSVNVTVETIADFLEMPVGDLKFRAAGVNHLSWLVELSGQEGDLYPLLRKKGQLPEIYNQDPVRFDLMHELGVFPTESSGHVSEYVPYFRTHAKKVQSWNGTGQRGESGYYAHNWPTWRRENDLQIARILAGKEEFDTNRGTEYPAQIVESMITGNQSTVFVSTMNNGLVSNLMQDNVVEVAARVDSNGIVPQAFGNLPEHLAPLVRRHQEVNALAVQAILNRDREAAVHALMLDPLTSAACEIGDIRRLFDEMVDAQSDYLPEFLRPSRSTKF